MDTLEIKQLHKTFGNKEVLSGLDMNVPEGSIFGFVGQNGAGKTTTMKIILGLLKASKGSVYVCGEKVVYGDTKTNKHIGYLPDVPIFYDYMKALEYLLLCGQITGLTKKETLKRSKELLELVGIKNENQKIKTFSRGMKQRLGIAQALLNEPKLLICDEPTSALDPIGRSEILKILSSIKGKTTVIFSTHILSDVESICDYLAILDKGKLTYQGSLEDIRKQFTTNGFLIEFQNTNQLDDFLALKELKNPDIQLSQDGKILTVLFKKKDEEGHFLIDLLSKNTLLPLKFEKIEPSLDKIYRELIK